MAIMHPVVFIILFGVLLSLATYALTQRRTRRRSDKKLETSEKRIDEHIEELAIRPLSADERMRFQEFWQGVQSQFLDDPCGSLESADNLVTRVMVLRGYPVEDFEQRAGEVSVNHPKVVQNFRAGHNIALRAAKREASMEDIRQAMISYRQLFDDLVDGTEMARTHTVGR